MKITKIERQKKDKQRYSIYIDGEFAFGIHENVLIKFALNKGKDLTQDELNQIKEDEYHEYVYSRALNYLSYGIRSIKEMKDYLKKQSLKNNEGKEVPIGADLIQRTISRLVDNGLLNDIIYGESYVRTMSNLNRKGPKVIQQDLIQKGLTKEEIEDVLQEYPEELMLTNIKELAEKFIKSNRRLTAKALQQKLNQHLLTKGFDKEHINEVIEEEMFADNRSHEEDLIEKEAEKILRKRRRKFQGRDLEQKLKEGLYLKGFDFELINQWISEHTDYFVEDEV